MLELNKLTTEARNPGTAGLDTMTPLEIATVMNREDEQVVAGVRKVLPEGAAAIGWVQESFEAGGKLVYMGAGTSGCWTAWSVLPPLGFRRKWWWA